LNSNGGKGSTSSNCYQVFADFLFTQLVLSVIRVKTMKLFFSHNNRLSVLYLTAFLSSLTLTIGSAKAQNPSAALKPLAVEPLSMTTDMVEPVIEPIDASTVLEAADVPLDEPLLHVSQASSASEPVSSLQPSVPLEPSAPSVEASEPQPAPLQSEWLESQDLGQVTSVTQLSDVQPGDWAYQALQSLVERYGCIAGYPDGTYRGQSAMTRYEFAAGLNACLDRISELIAASTADLATREDLATLQRLQEEFAAELATLRGRVDDLEVRTAELEANQFSTTTRLNGETIFALSSIITGDNADGDSAPRNPTGGYRIRLNFDTSFFGEDLLTARLQTGNVEPLGGTNSGVLLTNEGRIEYDGNSEGDLSLALLRYVFPIGSDTEVYIAGTGNGFVDLGASTQLNPYFDGRAVSLFALRNPIYNYSFGAGLGLRQLFFDETLELNLGYLVPDTSDPIPGGGLFNGKYGALAQLIAYPFDQRLRLGLTYINAYSPGDEFGLATGSNLANESFDRPVVTNAYGLSGVFDITPNIAIGGWVGYSNHRYIGRGDGNVWNWAANLAFVDFGGEGNTLGFVVGMEPKLTDIDDSVNGGETDEDTSLHLEAFYRYVISDNLDITPGVIWLTAPNHNNDNNDVVIGVLRTRFFF
jgi:hypothetical protein